MKQLTVWKILQDDKCILCNVVEDAEHMYTRCTRVLQFHQHIERILFSLLNENVSFSWKNIILGVDKEYQSNNLVNLVISLAAFSIFKTWALADKNPSLLQDSAQIWKTFHSEVEYRCAIDNIWKPVKEIV